MERNSKLNLEIDLTKTKTMKDLMGTNGVLRGFMKQAIETILQQELVQHLAQEKEARENEMPSNSKNGKSSKIVRSDIGEVELAIPRDRNANFEPQLVKKYQKDIGEFDKKIISMYARGMTTRDIQDHVQEIYGAEVSASWVSMVTDKVQGVAIEWQNRPLEPVYVVVYFDAIHYRVRDNGKIVMKAAYTCIGVDTEGQKDLLGLWVGENEGSRFWFSVATELKNRGVNDILIACMDGLKGLPDAIKSVFPKVQIQLCIIHMIRNSMKYIGYKSRKQFIDDLKHVYQAISEKEALHALDKLKEKWGKTHPLAVNPWVEHWHNLSGYFQYPFELRRLIYTTNVIESLHRQFRKVTKNRSILANDEALFKILYLAGQDIQRKWSRTVRGWDKIVSQIHFVFKERLMVN
jgi:putative transposase